MPTQGKKRQSYPLDQSPFYRLGTRRMLAEILGISNGELRKLSKNHNELYREFDTPKKSGGTRHVENPRKPLKIVQARMARFLARIKPPDYLYCPVKRRCYVTNAAQHCNHRVIHCLDVKKYYPSTPARRVYWFFHTVMQCPEDIAGLLTSLATYREHLPTGSPLSPILAHFAFYDIWEEMARQCKEQGVLLTVYVDDVTLSGESLPRGLVWGVRQLIHRAGLRYHKEKHYVDHPAEITGVIVSRGEVLAPHRQLKKLHEARLVLKTTKDKEAATKLKTKITGIEGQLRQIENVRKRLSERSF